jgi:hypothetical protein
MTKDQLKKYLDSVIDDIRKLYINTQERIQEIQKNASSEWTTVYSVPVHMTPEQQATNAAIMQDAVNKLNEEYRNKVDAKIQEAMDFIATLKKTAIQDVAAAEPVPTDIQLRMAEQIKKEYGYNGNALALDRVNQFETDMNYHVDNETVKGYPYYLVAMELFPDNAEILDSVYKKLFPSLVEKKAALADIEECERFFKATIIIHKFDTISNPTEADQLELIRMKTELAELGEIGKLNQRVIRYL